MAGPAGIRSMALAPDAISRVPAGRPTRARPLASCGPGRGFLDRPTLTAGPPADPSVRGGFLHVAQRHPRVQPGGDERVPQRVRRFPVTGIEAPRVPPGRSPGRGRRRPGHPARSDEMSPFAVAGVGRPRPARRRPGDAQISQIRAERARSRPGIGCQPYRRFEGAADDYAWQRRLCTQVGRSYRVAPDESGSGACRRDIGESGQAPAVTGESRAPGSPFLWSDG